MKARILVLAAGIATLTSCTSLYKTGQTPDDVYYSPARPVSEYVQSDYTSNDGNQSYQEYQDSYRDDRFLRLSIGNPYYLSCYNTYDGFDWRYNAYATYWDGPWNNYWAWNNFYNPYGYYYMAPVGGYIGSHALAYSSTPISKPVAFSNSSYNSPNSARYVYRSNGTYYNPGTGAPRYNNGNGTYMPGTSQSNSLNNSNTYTPSRSYAPAPSAPSGGGGGGGGVSRPTRN